MSARTRKATLGRGLAALGVLALVSGVAAGAASLAKKKWSQATTRSFVVTAEGGERDTRRIAEHLATIHAVFRAAFPNLFRDGGPRVPVLGVRGEKGMEPFLGERARRAAGALRSAPLRRDILVRTDLVGQQSLATVYHEYVHLVLRQNVPHIPIWLNEGLAEVWSDLDVSNPERIKVGRPRKTHLGLLRSRSLVPLPELLSADTLSELYTDPELKSLFYAQSWALTHYLTMAEERKHAASLERYVALVGTGVDPIEAAARLFGDLAELEQNLWSYVRALTIPYLILSLPQVAEETVEVRRLTEAEALATVADFLLFFRGGREEARRMFERGLELAPTLALAQQGLGMLDLDAGEYEAAAARFERALTGDPALWLSHYGRALALDGGELDAEPGAAEEHLRRAIDLQPDASPALCRLGFLLGRGDETRHEGREMIRRAVAIDPGEDNFRVAQLAVQRGGGGDEEAAAALDWLLARARESGDASLANTACWEGTLSGVASRALAACELSCTLDAESVSYRDSRGLARALAGDTPGAIGDFRFVVGSEAEEAEELRDTRSEWLRVLESGGDPFDAGTLEELRGSQPPC